MNVPAYLWHGSTVARNGKYNITKSNQNFYSKIKIGVRPWPFSLLLTMLFRVWDFIYHRFYEFIVLNAKFGKCNIGCLHSIKLVGILYRK